MNLKKQHLLEQGIALAERWCGLNGVPMPQVIVKSRAEWRFDACAYYREDRIVICPDRCASIGTGGRAWSYPGYQIDRTPYGVIAHELGHHVDRTRSLDKGAYGGNYSQDKRRHSGEAKLTGYCPNDWEWFAEMFRLFVTNPELLRAIRPVTYKSFTLDGLKPVEQRAWHVVLKDAPDRTLQMAQRRIMEAQT